MKRFAALALLTVCVAGAQNIQRFGNVQFQPPPGWEHLTNPQAALLRPPQGKNPGVYAIILLPGVQDIRDSKLKDQLGSDLVDGTTKATAEGEPQPFPAANGTGFRHSWMLVDNAGNRARLQLYVVDLKGGGAAAVVAMANGPLPEAELTKVATSVATIGGSVAPSETHPIAKQWDQRLRGTKLVQISSSAGQTTGGGWESKRELALLPDGKFTFTSSSSVIANVEGAGGVSKGASNDAGVWRVYVQNGQPYLELTNAKGQRSAVTLEDRQGATYVDNQRWMVDRR
jgi:hypothetical protein